MAISYLLSPMPEWVIIGLDGLTAGGAKLYTKSNLDPTQDKAVYQDVGGTIPYENPIIFGANGTRGPFYWKVDSGNLSDTYFLLATDANNNELFTIRNFFPPGSGGGGSSTTNMALNNLIANNTFIDHMDDITPAANLTNTVICPSNHHGFTPDLINPVIGTYGALGPDIRFVKNNTGLSSDQITFVDFARGTTPFAPTDATPVQYLRYQCSGSPAGETLKAFQFPITQKVKNLENTVCTFAIWAKTAVNPFELNICVRQYFGSGSAASAEVCNVVGTIDLTTSWTLWVINFTVPSVAGSNLGQCGDDALYIQLGLELGANCDIQLVKPAFYQGELTPNADFESYDEIDEITQSPRTGDIKHCLRTSASGGWLAMNDGTIGLSSGTARANVDTFPLYKTLWDGVSDTYAPVSTGRGASAVADFSAGKTITLTRSLGRVLTGNAPQLITAVSISSADPATDIITVTSNTTLTTGTPVITSGGSLPAGLNNGQIYYVIRLSATTIKLALSVDFAQAGTPIVDVTATGTGSLLPTLGAFIGEGAHILTEAELASHAHGSLGGDFITSGVTDSGGSGSNIRTHHATTATAGNSNPHNTVQPSIFTNVFIKL